ncbi:MAG: hypothetical protein Q3M24_10245 [Candidatus Electrothrix aestuarii]|uniref:Nucleotidyl transferase AbiEii toxin, Type IV TA system n=1 Tax=Candidatus Electrothrix aestuarii TaxID=3062594 RepID=A0AAU8M0R4_9BACT|nr:hypothetical protein [Candidatus Electrothrix aestuarii]
MDLFTEFSRLVKELNKKQVDYALCGGLAMAVYAFPRATLDIDILIEPERLEKTKKIAEQLGFNFDAGLMRLSGDAIQIYRLMKISPNKGDTLMLDMLLVTQEMKHVWAGRQRVSWDEGELPVVSPRGLIELKSKRLSGQDQDDIMNLRSLLDED